MSQPIESIECVHDAELVEPFFDATPEDVMRLIETIVRNFFHQLRQREEPSLSVISRSNGNAVFCSKEQHLRLRLGISKRKLSDGKRFQGIWKVLQCCYGLRRKGKSVNQRELYYMNTDV